MPMRLAATSSAVTTSYVVLLAALLVRGIGMGAAVIPLTGASFIGLPRDDVPSASIISRVAQQIGGSLGTAVMVVVLQSTSAGSRGPDDLAHGFSNAFWWAIAFTAVATPICLLLPGRPTSAHLVSARAEAEAVRG